MQCVPMQPAVSGSGTQRLKHPVSPVAEKRLLRSLGSGARPGPVTVSQVEFTSASSLHVPYFVSTGPGSQRLT